MVNIKISFLLKQKKYTFQNITKCIHRLQCVQDILGATNPCINCICEIIDDICGLFGCDLNCHPTTAPSNTVPTSYIQQ